MISQPSLLCAVLWVLKGGMFVAGIVLLAEFVTFLLSRGKNQ